MKQPIRTITALLLASIFLLSFTGIRLLVHHCTGCGTSEIVLATESVSCCSILNAPGDHAVRNTTGETMLQYHDTRNGSSDNVSADNLSAEGLSSDNMSADNLSAEGLSSDNMSACNMPAEGLTAEGLTSDGLPADGLPADDGSATCCIVSGPGLCDSGCGGSCCDFETIYLKGDYEFTLSKAVASVLIPMLDIPANIAGQTSHAALQQDNLTDTSFNDPPPKLTGRAFVLFAHQIKIPA